MRATEEFTEICRHVQFWFESEWKGSREAIYSMVTRLWVRRSGVRISAGVGDLSVLQNIQTGSMAHLVSHSLGNHGSILWLRASVT
jgi:hypothetical protein